MSFHAFCVYFLAFWGRHGRDGERLAQCFAHDCAGRHALGNGRRFGRPATTLAQRNVLFPSMWSCCWGGSGLEVLKTACRRSVWGARWAARLIVGIPPLGSVFFQSGVRRRKYKLGPTKKFPVQIFASLARVYISSSSPQSGADEPVNAKKKTGFRRETSSLRRNRRISRLENVFWRKFCRHQTVPTDGGAFWRAPSQAPRTDLKWSPGVAGGHLGRI